jgi:AraC-like DNA-binding protein
MSTVVDEDLVPHIRHVILHKCTPSWELAEQELDCYNLTYLIQGDARYIINGKTVDLSPGNLLVLPPDTIRRGNTFPDRLMHCFSVDFDLRNSLNQDAALPFPVCSLPGRHEDIMHLFHDLSFSWLNKQPGYLIKSRGLFLQILHRFLELVIFKDDAGARDSRIARVVRYMTAHYTERITVKMMAKMAGLNPTYFGLLFRREMGVSLNRYVIQLRVKNAENMLASGEYKVGNIAEACGFIDMSHFYKQFKLIKGFPPSHSLPKKF